MEIGGIQVYPIKVDGIWVDHMGHPWHPPKPYPGKGPRARQALARVVTKPDPEEAARRTQKSQTYWAAYRAGQAAKREAGVDYSPPGWLGKRKEPKRRQWLPGEHKKAKPSTTAKEQNVPPPAAGGKKKPDQGELF